MTEFLLGLIIWASVQMGIDPKSVGKIEFMMVSTEEMALLAGCSPEIQMCRIAPAMSDEYRIYILKENKGKILNYQRDRKLAGFIVHHIVHHIQYQKLKKDPKKYLENFRILEKEADEIQSGYEKAIDT